jgi:hypothetical protein
MLGGIPVPATFIHDISELLKEEATSILLYSRYPFPNRAKRQHDEFQAAAWNYLIKIRKRPLVDKTPATVSRSSVSRLLIGWWLTPV